MVVFDRSSEINKFLLIGLCSFLFCSYARPYNLELASKPKEQAQCIYKRLSHLKGGKKKFKWRKRLLVHAVEKDDLGLLSLVRGNIDIAHFRTKGDKMPLLYLAASMGSTKVVRHLLDTGVPADSLNAQGQTAYFPGSCEVTTVALLKAKGVDPNLKDMNGNVALHMAVIRGRLKGVKNLIKVAQADPLCRNVNGKTPYALAYTFNSHSAMQNYLRHRTLEKLIEQNSKCAICKFNVQELREELGQQRFRVTTCCTSFLCRDCWDRSYVPYVNQNKLCAIGCGKRF